jgi:hypothetical protein
LDELSKGRGARARVTRLRDEIAATAPEYKGLADIFDKYLLSHVIKSAQRRAIIIAYLKAHWFEADEQTAFFPRTPLAEIYAEGVLKALNLSLHASRTIPLNAWWILDADGPKVIVLGDQNPAGMTIRGRVTLLILTPRPKYDGQYDRRPILGETAQAWVSEEQGDRVTTRSVRDLRDGPRV